MCALVARRTLGRGGWMRMPPDSTCVASTNTVMNATAMNNQSSTNVTNGSLNM